MLETELIRPCKIYPPSSQLIKWVGSKQKFVCEMSEYFPLEFNNYYEPFLGSGSVLASIRPTTGFASDIFKPLIEIWETLKSNPELLIKWYSDIRNRIEKEDRNLVYYEVRESFNKYQKGSDFLYLTRTCWGGVIRFRKRDGYMSTPIGWHNPMKIESFGAAVFDWHARVQNTVFKCCDYKLAFETAKKGDFIFCDPPYKYNQSILYGSHNFNLHELFECISFVKSKGVFVAMSIDGNTKSGKQQKVLRIPEGLFERQIDINNRLSMLLRFKKLGQKLTYEHDSEKLYLTY